MKFKVGDKVMAQRYASDLQRFPGVVRKVWIQSVVNERYERIRVEFADGGTVDIMAEAADFADKSGETAATDSVVNIEDGSSE